MKAIPATASSLAPISFFAKFETALRKEFALNCRGQIYDPQEVILVRGGTNHDVHFVISGAVHTTNFSHQGKEITLRVHGAGAAFGLLSALDGQPRATDAIAKQRTVVARMTGERFRKLMQDHPAVNREVTNYLVHLVRTLANRVIELGTLNVNQRLYAELLRLSQLDEGNFDHAVIYKMPTHADLASRIATHREAVSRELKRLMRTGLLNKDGRDVWINKVSMLRDMIARYQPPLRTINSSIH